jgi:hypothetical protein
LQRGLLAGQALGLFLNPTLILFDSLLIRVDDCCGR